MTSNAENTRTYFEIMERLNGDIKSRRAAHAYMLTSSAIVHHRHIESSFIPRLFNRQTYMTMKEAAETTYSILCKVIRHYLSDADYRRIFDFDKRIADLILLPRGYDAILPFARVDAFLNEDTFDIKFCEFNSDGSAGMNENREVTNAIKDSQTFRTFAREHRVQGCNLFETWIDIFLNTYDTYIRKVDAPHIAICDYLENGVVDEFREFAKCFEKRGLACDICDVRELHFDGQALLDGQGERIDAIWRRCVTNDVLTYWSESQDLIEAVRAEKVALIGSFTGHIVHDKQIFEVLYRPETWAFLTPEEIKLIKRSIPQTVDLSDNAIDISEVRENKNSWIIKPRDHYGADNIYAGCEVTQTRWNELIDRFANGKAGYKFLVQRYLVPYQTETLPPDTSIEETPDADVSQTALLYNNISGLYLFNGTFAGVFSRLGPHPTIYKENEGMTAATIWVDADIDDDFALELS